MDNATVTEVQRRTVLQLAAGLATAGSAALNTVRAAAIAPTPTGKPGDFDFLSGHWKIKNRRLKDGAWDEFDSEASVHAILGGVISVEELRIPARNFSGMGLRMLDVERKLWADYWVNGKSGVLAPPPAWGSFVDGRGTWDSDETDADKPIIVRGVWDQITPTSCRWFQAVSRDDGKTWQENWVMHWTRA
ncbi:hypothetical protein [Roseateles toxinivorans]|uniref:DUF1579 domain-containing protein n=1 Tax=Roseateles toxinivorans TaxID=270368 RepID=A0A4R6QFP6_9BURK|nr:hypothetical protein [Roseateles toxinivorans]TDP61607.1 hypothetical protein DES47_11124 [Roseateles toxinivorans]